MSRILVIDDEQVVRELMVEILADGGHEVAGAATAQDGLAQLEGAVDLVVSDIVMPGLSGLELLEEIRLRRPSLPVVLVTGAGTYGNLTGALARGADGLVTKPFSHAELRTAVSSALDRAGRSELEVRERVLTPTLASALANAIEARDPTLHGHCERLAAIAVRIAEDAGLAAEQIEAVRLGAVLHDVGKIGIPDRILLKPGPLDAEERAVMRTHPVVGDSLLEPLDVLATVRPVVRHHHERWDGSGYPDGLARDAIPLLARIVSLADALEAMSADRPYRARLGPATILAELRAGAGSQWDPRVAALTLDLLRRGELRHDDDGFLVAGAP